MRGAKRALACLTNFSSQVCHADALFFFSFLPLLHLIFHVMLYALSMHSLA